MWAQKEIYIYIYTQSYNFQDQYMQQKLETPGPCMQISFSNFSSTKNKKDNINGLEPINLLSNLIPSTRVHVLSLSRRSTKTDLQKERKKQKSMSAGTIHVNLRVNGT